MTVNLLEEQRRIEEEATLTGVRRAARAMEKAKTGEREATTKLGSAMVRRIVSPMTELLREDLQRRVRGVASKGGTGLNSLRTLDAHLVCLTATRAALATMSKPTKLTAVARRIGEALEDETIWQRWEKLSPSQAASVRRRVNQSPSAHQRRRALRGFAKHWEERALAEAWSSYKLIGVGMRFVDYLVRLGIFAMDKVPTRRPGKKARPTHVVRLTPEAAAFAKDLADFLAISRPLNWPLVLPPVPWSAPFGGGFHFREGNDHPLIPRPLKPLPLVRRASKEQRALLEAADLSVVYAGLNAAQATAWRINPNVYSVMLKMMEAGRGGPGLTALDPVPEPGRLPDEEAADPEKLRHHKATLRKAKSANVKMVSKRFAQHRIFATARKFVGYSSIYFAYNLDFRGRVYACSDDLSPQGNDLQRGLLEFANGDAMTANGFRWLLIHAANCFGIDKVSFAERMKWALDNSAMIHAVADDPLDCLEWHKADQPWQFLAACFAIREQSDNPEAPCRVPVMLDGSCSGIQHYAALLRDAEAGALVNLVPSDKPQDLYAAVSDRVDAGIEWAAWGVTRKEVKRSVMVLPYGGTFLSNLDYVRDAVRKRLETEGRPSWITEDTEHEKIMGLAKATWEAMHDVVKAPIEGMRWVRRVVKAWASDCPNRKLHWTAPCGFPVVTDYLKTRVSKPVTETVAGEVVNLKLMDAIEVTDWGRVETAAAPNFVHSLDASHLLFSLKRAKEAGLDNLAIVHDAFGTTPTKTEAFSRILREEFSKLYIYNPFECLGRAAHKVGVTYPEYPPRGTLSMEAIARSEYLFA